MGLDQSGTTTWMMAFVLARARTSLRNSSDPRMDEASASSSPGREYDLARLAVQRPVLEKDLLPKKETISRQAGLSGSTTATWTPKSMVRAPSSSSMLATVPLPVAMLPVTPSRKTFPSLQRGIVCSAP
jgi:hypothetical protein